MNTIHREQVNIQTCIISEQCIMNVYTFPIIYLSLSSSIQTVYYYCDADLFRSLLTAGSRWRTADIFNIQYNSVVHSITMSIILYKVKMSMTLLHVQPTAVTKNVFFFFKQQYLRYDDQSGQLHQKTNECSSIQRSEYYGAIKRQLGQQKPNY